MTVVILCHPVARSHGVSRGTATLRAPCCVPHTKEEAARRMRIAQAQREQIRAALIGAGLELFRRRGFAATTVEAVAADAGVAKGTFYNYFSTKEDLALAALAPMLRDARATLDGLSPRASLRQRLDQLLDLLGAWSSDSPDLVWVWATELPRRGVEQPGSALFHEMLTSLFAVAQAAGQARPAPGPEQLAIGLEGVLLSQVAHWYHDGARGDLAGGLRQAADVYLTGAATGAPAGAATGAPAAAARHEQQREVTRPCPSTLLPR